MAVKEKTHDVETTGHEWDGIEELNSPLPRWWVWTFYATIIWGVIYTILYPAWPMVSGATRGIWHYTTRQEVAADIAAYDQANAAINGRLAAADLTAIAGDSELQSYAFNAGGAVFKTWCAQCHGSGAAGAKGYPNLLDNDWLWGGSVEDIAVTITHGVRNQDDPDARYSEMPAFGEFLESSEIEALVNHVLEISGQDNDPALAAQGATLFADNCAACHGDDGTGDRTQGAPNLTDAIWLYGGDPATLATTITFARFGVMPNWNARLDQAQINAVATYVHSLGGGE